MKPCLGEEGGRGERWLTRAGFGGLQRSPEGNGEEEADVWPTFNNGPGPVTSPLCWLSGHVSLVNVTEKAQRKGCISQVTPCLRAKGEKNLLTPREGLLLAWDGRFAAAP